MRQMAEVLSKPVDISLINPLQVELTPLRRIRVLDSMGAAMDEIMMATRQRMILHILEEFNETTNSKLSKLLSLQKEDATSFLTAHTETAALHVIPRMVIYNAKPDKAEEETIRGIAKALQNGDIQPFKQAFNTIASLVHAQWLSEFIGRYSMTELYRLAQEGAIVLTQKQQSLLEEMMDL